MRKFRNAAVAVTSAVALTLSGTAIASAQNDGSNFVGEDYSYTDTLSAISSGSSEGKNSSQIGKDLDAWDVDADGNIVTTEVTGTDLLGSKKDADAPVWAQFWRDTALLGAIGTIVGGIITAFNWAFYNGYLPTIPVF